MNPSVLQHQAKAVNTVLESMQKSKLLPKKVLDLLPPLGATENQRDPTVFARYFTPDSSWTWFVLEFDGVDMFYGLVDGDVRELGYFSLTELQGARGHLGLPVERDLYFEPRPLSEID